jgi:hypothetical protein
LATASAISPVSTQSTTKLAPVPARVTALAMRTSKLANGLSAFGAPAACRNAVLACLPAPLTCGLLLAQAAESG